VIVESMNPQIRSAFMSLYISCLQEILSIMKPDPEFRLQEYRFLADRFM
jgi:hypothetical protein